MKQQRSVASAFARAPENVAAFPAKRLVYEAPLGEVCTEALVSMSDVDVDVGYRCQCLVLVLLGILVLRPPLLRAAC